VSRLRFSLALLSFGAFAGDAAAQDIPVTALKPTAVVGPEVLNRCAPLERVMRDDLAMIAETSPDSMDDWRTKMRLPACRVTAAGSAVTGAPGEENNIFYEALRIAGWSRTPDPNDRPQDAALRLRYEGADCFFTPYVGIRLFTEAEFRVNNTYKGEPNETRYNYLAVCVEALPAAEPG
jgi:hypothetical protein